MNPQVSDWIALRAVAFSMLAAFLLASMAQASARLQIQTTKTYRAEGNEVIPYSVACSSGHWYRIGVATTSVGWAVGSSSDVIRRSILMQGVEANTSGVCVSTQQAVAVPCTDSTNGAEIIGVAGLTDYGETGWYCRCRTDVSTCTLKGYNARDKGDQMDITR